MLLIASRPWALWEGAKGLQIVSASAFLTHLCFRGMRAISSPRSRDVCDGI